MVWSNKEWRFICSVGQVPISSLKLNASLYLYSISITCFFSESTRHDLSTSMYMSNISLSDLFFLSMFGSFYG